MAERKRKTPPEPPHYPFTIETFRDPEFFMSGLRGDTGPSCFNGDVRIRRYRVTVEEISETSEVLAARLQLLWDHADNHHHWHPLRKMATTIGYELIGDAGSKVVRHG